MEEPKYGITKGDEKRAVKIAKKLKLVPKSFLFQNILKKTKNAIKLDIIAESLSPMRFSPPKIIPGIGHSA